MAQQKPTTIVLDGRRQASSRRLLNQRNLVIGFVVVCLLGLVVFAIRTGSRPPAIYADRPDATNAELVAHGKRVYATSCASCHGGDLKGEQGWPQRGPNGVMPASPLDESGQAWQ